MSSKSKEYLQILIIGYHHVRSLDFDNSLAMLTSTAAEASALDQQATREDISRIIRSLEIRDHRIQAAEAEIRKITEEYRKLRDELLPIFRRAKDLSQPLPYHPNSQSPDHPEDNGASPTAPIPPEVKGSVLSRKFSKKRLFLGQTPKSNSPTHIPQSVQEERKAMVDPTLDPSAAAIAASNHLTAGMNGGSQPSTSPNQANMPSPTSPNTYNRYRDPQAQGTVRTIYSHAEDPGGYGSTANFDRNASNPTPTPRTLAESRALAGRGPPVSNYNQAQPTPSSQPEDPPPSSSGAGPSVEIFKSFRVSMDDPCEKVLPAALKKYNINADWKNYALYIVHGDQERCLGLKEKPLIVFKQLDREGKKPMFMLRKHAAPMEGHTTNNYSGGMNPSPYDQGLGGRGQTKKERAQLASNLVENLEVGWGSIARGFSERASDGWMDSASLIR
ncbi:uncharacterized protein KY384_005052 [Bacidia gigantensis]|uniref:uncharacterized protein n=1 Tax=Bacidia gigantensis TaxID=2732470 RepID=UPI001D03C67F|nr:uncharacterized protein KY384_005052 [Bacidia gigantensis]KAG8530549.1 hypothetical protein KY384_005052 [Bacidia gigantensis]